LIDEIKHKEKKSKSKLQNRRRKLAVLSISLLYLSTFYFSTLYLSSLFSLSLYSLYLSTISVLLSIYLLHSLVGLLLPPDQEINNTTDDGDKKGTQEDSTNEGTRIESTTGLTLVRQDRTQFCRVTNVFLLHRVYALLQPGTPSAFKIGDACFALKV